MYIHISLSLSISLSLYLYIHIQIDGGWRPLVHGKSSDLRFWISDLRFWILRADLRTKILDFRGFDSSIILRGGIFMSVG